MYSIHDSIPRPLESPIELPVPRYLTTEADPVSSSLMDKGRSSKNFENSASALRFELPQGLKEDQFSEAKYLELLKTATFDPLSSLAPMMIAYQKAEQGKSFWAEAIAYVFLDSGNRIQSINWLEKSLEANNSNINNVDTLANLYRSEKQLDRGKAFADRLGDSGLAKVVLLAKLYEAAGDHVKAEQILGSLPFGALDEASARYLKLRRNLSE